MAGGVDASVIASAALALVWLRGAARSAGSCGPDGTAGAEGAAPKAAALAADAAWRIAALVRSWREMLQVVFTALAAASPLAALVAACSLGLTAPAAEGTSSDEWLGPGPLGLWRRWALLAAITLWRAEKLESLFQRMQRSVSAVRALGPLTSLQRALADPGTWLWPPFWGIVRRVALVAIASFGCVPFVLVALPSVVLDEGLWWALAWFQDLWCRKVCALPDAVVLLVLPLADLVHFIPVLVRVFLLAIFEYPGYEASAVSPLLLTVCALAWTAHNCHTVYTTLCVDLPDTARSLYAAARMG